LKNTGSYPVISGNGIRPLARGPEKGHSDHGGCAKTTCADDVCIKDGQVRCRAVSIRPESSTGKLFCNDLVSNLIMILLPSHSLKQWGQLGEILGGVRFP